MQDSQAMRSSHPLLRVNCSWCQRVVRLSVIGRVARNRVLRSMGWIVDPPYAPICDLCHAEQPWHLPVEDNELGEAMAAEDKAPKQTAAEAAAAYDAETLSRVWDLGSRLREAGQLDPVAVELVEHAWAALDRALSHPGTKVHGMPTGWLSSLRDRSEAL